MLEMIDASGNKSSDKWKIIKKICLVNSNPALSRNIYNSPSIFKTELRIFLKFPNMLKTNFLIRISSQPNGVNLYS